jgi:hypothetical protein
MSVPTKEATMTSVPTGTLIRAAAGLLAGALMLSACSSRKEEDPMHHKDGAGSSTLSADIARYAPTVIAADTSALSPGDRTALRSLVRAAAVMDRLFLRQTWAGNEETMRRLAADQSPEGRERYRYFMINMGPWSRLDGNSAFLPDVPPIRPQGANYYPDDMTRQEFDAWIAALAPADRARATGYFTTIRRAPDRSLTIVPYRSEYGDLLPEAARHLREAAAATDNPSLRTYLTLRADAFLSDDYYASDIAWMDLDSPLDITIGPYEVYMDELFNYKAAFEAFITLRNNAESRKLAFFADHLQEIENSLPIDPAYRNPKLGAAAPIRVVDLVVTGGEARAGVQTAAFNLPNDERVVTERGSKRVMLKNVQEAKFNTILRPIAALVLDPAQRDGLAFDPFFTHILAHELMHGLGPHAITVHGRKSTVRQEMKELSSALEEAKADVTGLFALHSLIDRKQVDASMERPLAVTFLAGIFRSVRFGITEAHGRGMALQFNYMMEHGAIVHDSTADTYRVDLATFRKVAAKLTGEIMTVQAEGDYAGAKTLLDRYGVMSPPLQRTLDRLKAIPVDIAPEYPLTRMGA